MAIISFAKTVDELLAGQKSVTRRLWKPSYRTHWQRWYDEGRRTHQAYNASPRVGGEQIGTIDLTQRPYVEHIADMPVADLEAEGGMVDSVEAFAQLLGVPLSQEVTVIRFDFEPTLKWAPLPF